MRIKENNRTNRSVNPIAEAIVADFSNNVAEQQQVVRYPSKKKKKKVSCETKPWRRPMFRGD